MGRVTAKWVVTVLVAAISIAIAIIGCFHRTRAKSSTINVQGDLPATQCQPSIESPRTTSSGLSGGSPSDGGWKFGEPYRVEPESPDLPASGSALLRTIVGWREEIHVNKAAFCLVSDRTGPFEYVRSNGTTRVRFPEKLMETAIGPYYGAPGFRKSRVQFPDGWEIEIDDETGRILTPAGLPYRTDGEVAELTRDSLLELREFDRFREVCRQTDVRAGRTPQELVDIRTNGIRRVSDKIFVGYRLVFNDHAQDNEPTVIVFCVDAWTGEIINEAYLRTGG